MMKNVDICAVIVSYNGDNNIEKQISEFCDFCNLIVIDNGSLNEFVEYLINLKKKYDFELIINKTNFGLAKALNQGLEFATDLKCKYLLTLDQDSFLKKEFVLTMKKEIDFEKRVISVGPYYQGKNDNTMDVNYLITSGNLILIDVLNKLGKYDEILFIDQIDIELSFRLLINNYKMALVKNTRIVHKIGEIERSYIFRIKYFSHSPNRFYYMFRNERYLLLKYGKQLKYLCFKSRIATFLMFIRIIFIERRKVAKLRQALKGWHDGKKLGYRKKSCDTL